MKLWGRLIALSLVFITLLLLPSAAFAQTAEKTVRVGWFESSFNISDENGRRSGYAYEYQQKVAAYTGWRYEYVHGSWTDLMQKLESGEIDLMSDVSHMPDRDEKMLFSSLSMGTEEYYLFILPDNHEISPEDSSTLNGKRVGINRGSIQTGFFLDWAAYNGIRAELVELTCTEQESLRMLEEGTLDAYVTVDTFSEPRRVIPAYKIGSSDFFFAVNRERPDLLAELNAAMSRIQDENRYYSQRLFEKYFNRTGANVYLNSGEVEWLSQHGKIRVAYQDDYLAFCAKDPKTGELTGILKDFLAYASDCMMNAHLDFEAVAYPTMAAAMDALEAGEADCVFPASLGSYDGERMGAIMTRPLVRTDMYAIVHAGSPELLFQKAHVIVAVNEGNPNYDAFLLDYFPSWRKIYYPTTADCLQAVADNVADCVLISYYRYNNISRFCEKHRLSPITTGIGLDYCFAVHSGDTQLYSILSKAVGRVPASTLNAAASYYISEDAKLSFTDFLRDNLGIVMSFVSAVVLVILFFLVLSLRSERKARRLISATEIDELTGLYSRNYFFQYANRMFREHPNQPLDAIVLNIEQFHMVNALNGREFGDLVLQALGRELQQIADEHAGIAGRFEADRFDIYCRHPERYQEIFDRLQKKLDGFSPNASLRLRMGVMPWLAGMEPVQLFDRARTACNMARGHYKEHLIVFNADVDKREVYEQRLLNDLRRGLDAYEFKVFYQPKFSIQQETPELVSAEALIRWRHPELGMIPPDDFIPLFERNGRISEVDQFVWEQAAKQISLWRAQYGVTLPVSVNLSRLDVFDPALEETLDRLIAYYGLAYSDFKLEVTESAYTENSVQVIQVVEGLRRKGYQVEMDDFGTGYSSLNMLSAMPVDVLKMDRAFIRNIEHEEKDLQLVALIVGIAKSLKIPVIAEGVETEKQVSLLRGLGCAMVQGYYFSKPLSAAEFERKYIKGRKKRDETGRVSR